MAPGGRGGPRAPADPAPPPAHLDAVVHDPGPVAGVGRQPGVPELAQLELPQLVLDEPPPPHHPAGPRPPPEHKVAVVVGAAQVGRVEPRPEAREPHRLPHLPGRRGLPPVLPRGEPEPQLPPHERLLGVPVQRPVEQVHAPVLVSAVRPVRLEHVHEGGEVGGAEEGPVVLDDEDVLGVAGLPAPPEPGAHGHVEPRAPPQLERLGPAGEEVVAGEEPPDAALVLGVPREALLPGDHAPAVPVLDRARLARPRVLGHAPVAHDDEGTPREAGAVGERAQHELEHARVGVGPRGRRGEDHRDEARVVGRRRPGARRRPLRGGPRRGARGRGGGGGGGAGRRPVPGRLGREDAVPDALCGQRRRARA